MKSSAVWKPRDMSEQVTLQRGVNSVFEFFFENPEPFFTWSRGVARLI